MNVQVVTEDYFYGHQGTDLFDPGSGQLQVHCFTLFTQYSVSFLEIQDGRVCVTEWLIPTYWIFTLNGESMLWVSLQGQVVWCGEGTLNQVRMLQFQLLEKVSRCNSNTDFAIPPPPHTGVQ